MNKYELLQSQKNKLLEIIKYKELDPFNFEWVTLPSKFGRSFVPSLQYKGTSYHFTFDWNDGDRHSIYSPGCSNLVDSLYAGSWDKRKDHFESWLYYLEREVEEPDLWEQLSQFRLEDQASPDPEIENLPFTVYEAQQITTGINRMRAYLEAEFDTVEYDHDLINQKLDYLIDAAKRQGRKDWFHTCIGILVSLGSALGLSPEHGSKLMHILKETVNGVVRLLQ